MRVLAVAAIAGAVAWHLVGAPRWARRLAPGWSWSSHFVGVMTYPDPVSGQLPPRDQLAYYDRGTRVLDGGDDAMWMEDTLVLRDAAARRILWQHTSRASVDPRTARHLDPRFHGEYYVFPRHVEKKTYVLRHNYLQGVPLAFQREEYVEDVLTYLFAHRGRGEYTVSYTTDTPAYPGLRIPEGHEVSCADDQFVFRAWVEPVTGEVVRLQEGCRSGDYVHDPATGRRLQAVGRWHGDSSGDGVRFRLEQVRRERRQVLFAGTYAAPALLLVGVFGLVMSTVRSRSRS